MDEAAQRRSIHFQLRAALCLVILALLLFSQQPVSPFLWILAVAYLASNIPMRMLPTDWFENPTAGYGLFFLHLAGLTIVLYSVTGTDWETLLLFFVTVFMATLGEDVPRSVGFAFGMSALYVGLQLSRDGSFLHSPESLLRIPLFLVTAVLCGFLAQELRRHSYQVRGLKDIQRALQPGIGTSPVVSARRVNWLAAARDLEQRFRNTLLDLNAAVWEMDVPTLKMTFMSDHAEQLLGHPVEKWLGEVDFWAMHIHPEDRDHVVEVSRKAISEGRDHSFEYRALAADGRVVWLRDIIRVVRDRKGRIRQLRGVMVDITAQKQLEEEFRQSQKMEAVGRLAGGVAHDFNNLLTVITGYGQLILERLEPEAPLRAQVEEINKAGERAAGLTRRLLAFSRRQTLAPQIVDLNAIISDNEKMLHRLIGEDIEVVTLKDPGLGKGKADPAQIEQVLLNLAINARDAMPTGGTLMIETSNVELDENYAASHAAVRPGAYVQLAISDTGTGMRAEVRAHIFEPFFTTKEKDKGTGLGLATVYGIVKQSDGNIWAYSEPGVGTTFKIYLPRVEELVEVAPPAEVQQAGQLGSETILLVEDEDGVRALAGRILRARGYVVLEASGPPQALQVGQQHSEPIHLLLTDVVMPQMNGRELAQKFLSTRQATKVLYMSGYTDDAIVHHGVLEAGVPFLQKPFTPEALLRKVRALLDEAPTGPPRPGQTAA